MGSTQFFTPHGRFPLIALLLGMLHCLFFQDLKDHRFLDRCVKFYSSILFKFKFGLLLRLSCLMLSIFIIIRTIIRIIKTTCFENIILIGQLERSSLKVDGLFLPITFPVLVTFTGSLTHTFRNVCSTSTLKHFWHSSYIFGIITHLLMDKYFP